jgi:hypothetical protein
LINSNLVSWQYVEFIFEDVFHNISFFFIRVSVSLCLSIKKTIFSQSQSKMNSFDSFENVSISFLTISKRNESHVERTDSISRRRQHLVVARSRISRLNFELDFYFIFEFLNDCSNEASSNQEFRISFEKTSWYLEIRWERNSTEFLRIKSHSANAY